MGGYNAAIRTFETVTDLRQQRGTANISVNVLGNLTVGDGGEGEFYWDSTSVETDNGATIFSPTVGSGAGRWKRNFNGCVYPRWWGAVANGTTDDSAVWQAVINFAAPLNIPINGEGKSYKIAALNLLEKTNIQNVKFVLTAGTYGLKINEIGQAPTVYKRNITLRDIVFSGSCTYALIVSTITGVTIKNLSFEACNCANDIFYLLNTYDSVVDELTFIGCTAGPGCACLNMPAGVNAMTVSNVYTSAFTDFGIKLTGGSALFLPNHTIQGATTGMAFNSCLGVTVESPYFENTVNPVEITSTPADVGSIRFHGGNWFAPYASHPNLSLNNGVMIRYVGGRNSISLFGGVFDVSVTSGKKMASVGNTGILNIYRPHLISGSNTPEVTDYLFKEVGASSVAGFYVEYTRTSNAYTVVRRTSGIGNAHIVECYDSNSNLTKSAWSPPTIGSAANALSFYQERISAAKTTSYSLLGTDDTVRFNTTSANLTATLPVANIPPGKIFTIKKTAGNNALTVIVSGGGTIDGSTSYIINGIGDVIRFQWDGTVYILYGIGIAQTPIINPLYFNTTLIDSSTITNSFLNTTYPIGATYPIGTTISFTNLSDLSTNVAESTRMTNTTWYTKMVSYKNS